MKFSTSIRNSCLTTVQHSLTALLLAFSLILQIGIGIHQAYLLDSHNGQQALEAQNIGFQSTQVEAKTLPLEQASLRNSFHWCQISLGFGFCILPTFFDGFDHHQLKLSNFLKADNTAQHYLAKYYHYLALLSVF